MRLRAGLVLAVWLGAGVAAFGQSQNKYDDYARAYVRNGDFSGSVLVARDGRVVFRKSYGMANYELSAPNTEKTRFHIASVSKTFTAAAVVLLAQQGKLKLSDPLSKWIPDYLNGEKITVEQMLTHRSGLPDYYALAEYPAKKAQRVTLAELIAWVKTKPLDFLPGSETRYSNTGYAFLAYIVEQVSGKSYEELVAEELFKPAGMKESGTFRDDALIPGRAAGYQPWVGKEGMRNAPAYDKTILTGAASLYSNIDDLHAWCAAVRGGKLFDLKKLAYPYGWGQRELSVEDKKRKFLEQDGRAPGFVAHVLLGVEDDVEVIALGNLEDGAVGAMAEGLARIVMGEDLVPPAARAKATLAGDGGEYAGRYEVRPDFLIDVKAEDGGLFLRGTGGEYLPLEGAGKDVFFYRPFYLTVRFQRDKAGKVERLLWKDYPCRRVAEKAGP